MLCAYRIAKQNTQIHQHNVCVCRKFTKIKGLKFCHTVIFPFSISLTLFFNCNGTKIKSVHFMHWQNIDGFVEGCQMEIEGGKWVACVVFIVKRGVFVCFFLLYFGYKSQLHNIFSTREVEKKKSCFVAR